MPTQADNTIIRAKVVKVHDGGEQQTIEAEGRHKERFGGSSGQGAIPHAQRYGHSENPPEGSIGHTVIPDGNPDKAMITSMEHPEHRPKDLQPGEGKFYDMWGHYLHKKEHEWHFKIGPVEVWLKDSGEVYIKADTIILDGLCKVGGPDAFRQASWEGTVDSSGDVDASNFATKVLLK